MESNNNNNNDTATTTNADDTAVDPKQQQDQPRKRRRRWGGSQPEEQQQESGVTGAVIPPPPPPIPPPPPPIPPPPPASKPTTVVDSKAKALALKESIRARLAALKAKKLPKAAATTTTAAAASIQPSATSSSLKRPIQQSTTTEQQQQQPMVKRAKVYELDMTVTAPTFQKQFKKKQPVVKVNPYLAHRTTTKKDSDNNKDDKQTDDDDDQNQQQDINDTNDDTNTTTNDDDGMMLDERLGRTSKIRKRNKTMNFIEPGTFIEIAERKRLKALNAEQSGFASGRKAGMYFQSTNMASIYGAGGDNDDDDDNENNLVGLRPEANEKTTFPYVMEWWDIELLPSKLKKQVASYEGKALSKQTQSQMQQLDSKNKKKQKQQQDEEEVDQDDNDNNNNNNNNEKDGTKNKNNNIKSKSLLDNDHVLDLQKRCYEHASLSYSKTAALIQHIVPIKPPWAKSNDEEEAQPTLYLTKRELKRQRKLRRQEKQRELQDLQAAGLVPPPEPRLTLKNFIRVMGDQAYLDPSQMEQKVMEQIQARQRAHMDRNEKAKLTKVERSAKLAKKLYEDTTKTSIHVALFYVKDMSHPYHRTKVDLNAQQYNVTGGVLECDNDPKLACVICEGGPKAIKRYTRLMLVRMKWTGGPEDEELDELDDTNIDDDDDDNMIEEYDADGNLIQRRRKRHKFNKDNKCELVWSGMATKRYFKGFVFQSCDTSDQAKKILREKGVGHYWDQVLTHASGKSDTFQLKLIASDDDDDDDNNNNNNNDDNDNEENYYGYYGNADADGNNDNGNEEQMPLKKVDDDVVMADNS